MTKYNVEDISEKRDFTVRGVSYFGKPKINTVIYVSKKVAHLVKNLEGLQNCLVFTEEGIEVADKIEKRNCFVFCRNPQLELCQICQCVCRRKV